LVGLGVLIALAASSGSIARMISASIYGVSLFLVYVASILFHTSLAISLPWKKAFETVDHCAIYLLIAGTYTPFLLVTLPGTFGWSLLALIWFLAIFGILYKVFFFYSSDLLSTLAYIAMGWLSLAIMQPLFSQIGWFGLGGLLLGGILYTLGAVFYLLDHTFRFAHAVWHSFVIAGSLCHYLTIAYFVIKV
jgi:hemolysin III